MFKLFIGLVVVAIAVVFGYQKFSAPDAVPAAVSLVPDSALCEGCNVIIIGVDTMRADHMGALGYERDTTPTLDALASKGYVFSQAISPASWTVPTFMAVFTGVFPSLHKVTNKFVQFYPKDKSRQKISNLKELSPHLQTFAEAMKSAGYATGGFTGDAGVGSRFGYGLGFDAYTDNIAFGGFNNSETHALSWLDSLQEDQKFFMFFHGYDLHGQYAIEEGYKSRFAPEDYTGPYKGTPDEEEILREAQLHNPLTSTEADVEFWKAWYDGKLRDADDRLARFITALEERDLMKDTLIVVLSDHGEEFFEHDGFDHGHTLYDEQLHVPLMFIVPSKEGGVQIDSQVSTIDLTPTIFDILGITPNDTFASQIASRQSLLPYFTDDTKAGYDVYSETDYRDFTHKRSVRTADGWKYILTLENGTEELYNLNEDPMESVNRIISDVEKAKELRTKVHNHLANTLKTPIGEQASTGCLPVYEGECE